MNNSVQSGNGRIEKLFSFVDRHAIIYLAILFGINFFVKILYAGGMNYWLDETSSIFRSLHPLKWMIRQSFTDPNPPLYFIILKGWMALFGISESGTRALSVLVSSATVFILYYLARQFINRETAIYVTLFFSVAQIHLYFSHETRGYTLLAFMAALSFYFYLRTLTIPTLFNLIIYALVNTLLLYIHPVPIILIIVQFLCLPLYFRYYRKGTLFIIAGQFVTAVLFGLWVLQNQWVSAMQAWIPSPDLVKLKELLVSYLNTDLILYFSIALLVTFIVLITVRYTQKRNVREDFRSLIVLFSWGLFPIFFIYIISQYHSRWDPRYMLFATPGLYLLVSFLISKLPGNQIFRILVAVFILVLSMINLKLNPEKGEDWPAAISFMNEHKDDSTLTIVCADYQFMSFSYYYNQDVFRQLDQAPELLKKENIYFTKGPVIFNYLDTSKFNKILLILSHEVAADPKGDLFRFLNERYPITRTAPYMMNVKAYLFNMDLHPEDSLLLDFENDSGFNIQGDRSDRAYSGNCVTRISKDAIYSKGLSCTFSEIKEIHSQYFTIGIQSWTDSISASANLVCSYENPDSIYYWNAVKINFSDIPGTWTETRWTLNIPHVPLPGDIIKIYAYNLGDDEIIFDDLRIVFYK